MPGKKVAREIHVFGRQAHLALVLETKRDCDVVEIGHAVHVDPRLRHRDCHIGVAEAQSIDEHNAALRIGNFLAHQVFARDAKMHRPLRQQIDDLGGREIRNLNAGKIGDGAAVVARPARLDELEPGASKERFRVRLQASFRRHRDDERRAHGAPRTRASRSIHPANPTAGMDRVLPSRESNPS